MSNSLRISAVLCMLALAGAAQGAEFTFHPSIAVSEEFTDNVHETRTNKVVDFITRFLPGVATSSKGPVFSGNLNYQFDYRYYAKQSRKNDSTHLLTATGHLTAIDNLLFLDVSDEYQRVSLDVTRDVKQESLFVNQSDRNVLTASPYLVLHPSQRTILKSGYRYVDTRYFDSNGIDKTDHIGFLELTHELTQRWSLTVDYAFIRQLTMVDDYSQHVSLAGFRYEYAEKSFLFAQGGYSWIKYDSGHSLGNLNWNAGATHVFDTVTLGAKTGVKYNEDPLRNITQETFVVGDVEKRLVRGALKLTMFFSEYVFPETDVLQDRKYGATARGGLDLTSYLSGSLAFTAEKYEQPLLGSYTRRLVVDAGLGYQLAKELTASLSYIYVDYYSPGIEFDNRQINRVAITIKKVF